MGDKKHILVVDDVTTNLKCLGEVLKENYTLSMAKSGEQALALLEKTRPDLILLDVKMPIMDGYTTLEKIKEDSRFDEIPVIFLTADNEIGSELRGLRMGACDFIHKPYEPEVMLSRVERILVQEDTKKKIAMEALRDPLTSLWNRKYMEEKINEFAAAGGTGSFLLLDLDNFKGINDNYGHVVGDSALIAFAKTLSGFVHVDDIVARIGGDEFAVFLKNASGKDLLELRIEDLIQSIETQISIIKEDDTKSSVSVGISAMPKNGKSFIDLYNTADKALYYVKRNGKSGFRFYDPSDKYIFDDDECTEVIDLSQLKSFIEEKSENYGPFHVEYDSFKRIYQFLRRYVTRTKQNVQVLMFTLKHLTATENADEMTDAMRVLAEAIKESLRKNDVSSKYTRSQYLVILMDVSDENRDIVTNRIVETWNQLADNNNIILKYDIEEITAED